jgi:pimeloyl-ACP methyl ester carboxylesterase
VLGCIALAACSSSSKTATPGATTTTVALSPATAKAAPTTPDRQVWLCKPGLASNPCLSDMTATVVKADGTKSVEHAQPASDPKIDCFYVYPTVSDQPTLNANLKIDPAEIGVAIAQASRYSQVCSVYAPMYRQVTIYGLFNSKRANPSKIAYADVVTAWDDYLAGYNHGRGVVLIGHSQGSFILKRLLAQHIENDATVRDRIVSAILLGGNVTVKDGSDVGGDFEKVPACHSDRDVGCVMAYSSFDHPPPANSLFGRSRTAGQHVLCTNPATLGGGSAPLDAYFPAHQLGGVINFTRNPLASTPWVRYPDLLTGECKSEGGADFLQVNDVRKSPDERLTLRDSLGPTWGLHIYDANVALGNLVDVVKSEAAAYASKG